MLQEDVFLLKSLLHERLGETEGHLARVMDRQKEFADEQKATRKQVKVELLQEIEHVVEERISRITNTQPVAVPSATVEGSELVTTSSVMQKLATFDGKITWDAYRAQFELLARMN